MGRPGELILGMQCRRRDSPGASARMMFPLAAGFYSWHAGTLPGEGKQDRMVI
jgi:hypothetical protein